LIADWVANFELARRVEWRSTWRSTRTRLGKVRRLPVAWGFGPGATSQRRLTIHAPGGTQMKVLQIKPFKPNLTADLARLFGANRSASGCWCMWFITSVKDYHAAGAAGNRARFEQLARQSEVPMGLIAYQDDEPVGWCAIGPKERFARALNTPTLKGHVSDNSGRAWFVPCFFVREDVRRTGITSALLARAVELASEHGATVVQGFPFAGSKRGSGGDTQVGLESAFASCGFEPTHRPSKNRVVMELRLK
jgi:GNAT superfamily N-acetyltransferase